MIDSYGTLEGTRLHFLLLCEKNRSDFTALRLRSQNDGLSHGLKIARQLSIFAPVCGLVPPFRVLPARRAK